MYPLTEPESESELLYDWRSTANQFVLATGPSRPTTSNFIFQLNTCGYSSYVESSLTRGWGLSFTIAAVFSSAVILRFESRGAHDHILYRLRFETPPTWRTRSLYLYPPGTGWPGFTPRHWVHLNSRIYSFL
jgi:hypothetical protein